VATVISRRSEEREMLRAPASWSDGSLSKAFYRPRRWSTSSACARTSASEPSVSHPFYERLNRLLDKHGFDVRIAQTSGRDPPPHICQSLRKAPSG
jgi:hypothetical protein